MLLKALLNLETSLALTLAWLMVFVMPLRWAKALFASPGMSRHGDGAPQPQVHARALGVARRVKLRSRTMPFATTCLVEAVAGALLLLRRGIRGATIRFGVRKNGPILEAHAWLIHDGMVLLGGEEAGSFSPLADLSM